ncbi:MAG: serine--tRNA ligase, partial [Myxococcota bacterium]
MLDVSRLEEALRRGREVAEYINKFKELNEKRKDLQGALDELRAERNKASKSMAKADKKSPEFAAQRDKLRELSQTIKDREGDLGAVEDEVKTLHMIIPNAPHASVPEGDDESGNVEKSVWGEKPSFDFEPKPHWDVGEGLGILDFEAAAKLSGARFCVLRGAGSRLNRALINFMIDIHLEQGYQEIWPPTLVRRPVMEATGQLPKFEDDAFKTSGENEFFLSPTAEVQLTNLHREEILEREQMPVRYTAYAPAFRAEAGSYGKDTRGLIRQHQFDKVELVKLTEPESSYDELESMLSDAEEVLRQLGLHYRVVTLCTGDIGFSAAKTYDIEVWLPGQNAYREISSVSNCEDFQARRGRIRYRPEVGQKPKL